MPETIEITVYTYAELSPQGRSYAQSTYNEPEDYWYEGIKEDYEERGQERGFDVEDIQWSGFHSQGDGASWTGQVHIVPFLAYHLKPDHPDYARFMVLIELIENGFSSRRFEVSRNSHMYNHENTMFLDMEDMIRFVDWSDTKVRSGIFAGAEALPLAESIYMESLFDDLMKWATDEARDYARDIYKSLRDSYDEYSSEEYFAELCDINEWRFEASGKLVSR
jgi:hypothetical protein